MDKEKIIDRITVLLESASAVQCDITLTFIEHMTGNAERKSPAEAA